jgi:hypothetical protein
MNQEKRAAQHQPVKVGELGGLEFHRCPCGFTLAKFKGGLFWIRATPKDKSGSAAASARFITLMSWLALSLLTVRIGRACTVRNKLPALIAPSCAGSRPSGAHLMRALARSPAVSADIRTLGRYALASAGCFGWLNRAGL